MWKAASYALLWFTKELIHEIEIQIFFVLMLMDLHMVVNQHPRLSLSLYK